MVCAEVFRFLLLGERTALKAYFAQIKITSNTVLKFDQILKTGVPSTIRLEMRCYKIYF